MEYPDLFKPIKLGGTLFRNRIFSSPTGHPDNVMGRFTDECVGYFERKAMGGAAAVTLGEASVDSRYGKNYAAELSLDSRQPMRGLSLMADRIRRPASKRRASASRRTRSTPRPPAYTRAGRCSRCRRTSYSKR